MPDVETPDKMHVSEIDQPERDAASVVVAVIGETLERLKPSALALALERRGIRSPKGRYVAPTIYRWRDGTITPPADALLEAARIAGISVDRYLYQAMENETITRAEFEELRQMFFAQQKIVTAIQAQLSNSEATTA